LSCDFPTIIEVVTDRILVCFDLDGVIADSSVAIPAAINAALEPARLGPLSLEALQSWIGPPLRERFAQLLAKEGRDPAAAAELVERYRTHYPALAAALTRVYTGVPEMLAELAPVADLVIVTSKPEEFAVPILDGLGLLGRFRSVFAPSLDEVDEAKVATLEKALAEYAIGRPPFAAVMIGDRKHDIEAAHANGLLAIGALWGFGSRRELVEAGADFLAERPADVSEIVTHDLALPGRPNGKLTG
jgi:phosphoglycolate phosphatase